MKSAPETTYVAPTSMDVTTWTAEQLERECERACSSVCWAVVYMGRETDTYIENRDALANVFNEWRNRPGQFDRAPKLSLAWLDKYERMHTAAYKAA